MPDEVILDVTTIQENVTVETTAGDVVEIQVLAPTGNSATISVGTTTTGAAGTNASVTNSGTTSAAVFNFTIPRGDTGAAGASGGSSTAWRYGAKTNATSGYPTNGHLLWNNATQTSATEILVSHLDDDGTDIELFLSFFLEGQKIFIQNRDDSSQNQVWEINGTPTVTGANTSTAYYTFPVTLVSSAGAAFTNNHSILFGSIAAAVNAVTSATTSDGTAILDVESITGLYSNGDVFTATSGTGTAVSGSSDSGVGAQFYSQNNYGAIIGSAGGNSLKLTSVSGDYYIECENNFTTIEAAIERVRGWFVWFYNTFTGRLKTADITADRDWILPDASGTLALTSQLPTLGTNVATFLATPTSTNLAAAVTDETGSGSLVFGTSPSLTSPTIGTSATFNATTYTYGAGAALAHRNALGVGTRISALASNTSVTNTTTLQTVASLSVVAGKSYAVYAQIAIDGTVLTGTRHGLTFPASTFIRMTRKRSTSYTPVEVSSNLNLGLAETATLAELVGFITVTVTGTVELQFAQNTANANTTTCRTFTYLTLTELV